MTTAIAGAVVRSGLSRGLIEFRLSFSGAELVGQLFWPLATLATMWFFRGNGIDGNGVSLGALMFPGVLGMFVAFGMVLVIQGLAADREDGTLLRAKATPGGIASYLVAKVVSVSLAVMRLPTAGGRSRKLRHPWPQLPRSAGLAHSRMGTGPRYGRRPAARSRARLAGFQPPSDRLRLPGGDGTHRRVRHLLPSDAPCRPGCNGSAKPARSTGSVSACGQDCCPKLPPRSRSPGRGGRSRPPQHLPRGPWSGWLSPLWCCVGWHNESPERASLTGGTRHCSARSECAPSTVWRLGLKHLAATESEPSLVGARRNDLTGPEGRDASRLRID